MKIKLEAYAWRKLVKKYDLDFGADGPLVNVALNISRDYVEGSIEFLWDNWMEPDHFLNFVCELASMITYPDEDMIEALEKAIQLYKENIG